ncbi:hypothetical protein QFC24_003105 [Naganishia onofrii]|uniref:Uncharacterized protein n=1 Tax=Naganishia onofrii TaxID=1851511 RepID=A0ACC2XNA9_9TREE|nr:hypothetical protein QFC24_003105 [Naganishia onofrii]
MSAPTTTTKWQVRWSTSKNLPYFHNSSTEESRWDPPAGMSEAEIFGLSGAKECFERQQQVAAQQAQQAQQQQGGQGEEEKVRASHLLIKHAGSRRPASWKNPNITTTPQTALSTLKKHQQYLLSLPNAADLPRAFAELAATESDCASHAKGGDLGWFGRRMMQRPFEVSRERASERESVSRAQREDSRAKRDYCAAGYESEGLFFFFPSAAYAARASCFWLRRGRRRAAERQSSEARALRRRLRVRRTLSSRAWRMPREPLAFGFAEAAAVRPRVSRATASNESKGLSLPERSEHQSLPKPPYGG